MPLPDPNSADCVSNTIEQLESEGHDHDQAVAIAMEHCNKKIYKSGAQSTEDPFVFVMSTAIRDRYGDIVEQDWNLKWFKKNPIAFWGHDHDKPIGKWLNVRVEDGKLIGRLALALRGTSEFIDTLWSMVEQRILKAVSVGLIPNTMEALDEEDPWGGFRLSENELLECSLVGVPANPEALSFVKSMGDNTRKLLFAETGETRDLSVAYQLDIPKSRDSDSKTPVKPTRKKAMSLSDKIKAKQEQLTELLNQLSAITEGDEVTGEEGIGEAVGIQITELNGQITKSRGDLDIMLQAEQALAVKAAQRSSAREEAAATEAGDASAEQDIIGSRAPRIRITPVRKPGHKAIATVSCLLQAHIRRVSPVEIAKAVFKDEPEIEVLVRAATSPATTTDAAWAAPLVRETWGEFLDLIRDISVYPRLPGLRLDFDRYGKINLPKEAGGDTDLAGDFVEEGKPIPVKEGAYGTVDLMPKKLAIISTFTREIADHSQPAIQGLVQNKMLRDTAKTLDVKYLDAVARTAVRPAGMQDTTETGADNINAASGVTVAAIIADTSAMVGRMMAAMAGNSAVWVMNPLRVLGLRNAQDAASGQFVFRAEIAAGTFMGYPVIASQNVPAALVELQSDESVAYGNDFAPTIEVSDQATIVFDDTAPDDVLPDTNTHPAKSMFQMDGVAVKMRAGLDWRIVRQGGVQMLTGAAW